jgi:hypothetical protein
LSGRRRNRACVEEAAAAFNNWRSPRIARTAGAGGRASRRLLRVQYWSAAAAAPARGRRLGGGGVHAPVAAAKPSAGESAGDGVVDVEFKDQTRVGYS